MSYNAALRAIRTGYTQVLWYSGGIEAWKSAGVAVQPAGPSRSVGTAVEADDRLIVDLT